VLVHLSYNKIVLKSKLIRVLEKGWMDKARPWSLFYGACQGLASACGLGFVLYRLDTYFL
jgi:hypothetical protein